MSRVRCVSRLGTDLFRSPRLVRIALAYRNFNLGGSLERECVLQARELARLGVEVHVYCNPATRSVAPEGVHFHDVATATTSRSRLGYPLQRGTFAFEATRQLRRDRERYDIVEVLGPDGIEHDVVRVDAVQQAEHERLKAVDQFEGRSMSSFRSRVAPLIRPEIAAIRTIQRLQFRRGHYKRLIAVTPDIQDDLARVYGVPPELVDVVPYAIELDSFTGKDEPDPRQRHELGIGPNDRVLLFVGHAFRRKGLEDVIRILPDLGDNTHLIVVGGGDKAPFLALAGDQRVVDRIHFVGGTDEPQRFFGAADVFVLPTRHEPWGITLVESMAAGLPMVTTDVAGAASLIRESGAGLVVPPTSREALHESVERLLDDPDLRREMGARGRIAAQDFAATKLASRRLEIYEQIAAQTRGASQRPVENRRGHESTSGIRLAAFPEPPEMNPYMRLLYEHLDAEGFHFVEGARFSMRWLWASHGDVGLLHFHWPQGLYVFTRGPAPLRGPLSWAKTALFGVRLLTARLCGFSVVWTIHQVYPHDTKGPTLDRVAAVFLARASDELIAHDEWTAANARRELNGLANAISIVPHGSYIGVYPQGRSREDVRAQLGIADEAFLFLSFGELRAHKDLDVLLSAFEATPHTGAALLVAGHPKDPDVRRRVENAAARDERLKPLLAYIEKDQVAELFGACDAVVLPRGDGGTSGALLLALSMAKAVIAADTPTYRVLTDQGKAGWLFEPGNPWSLRQALESAADDPSSVTQRGRVAQSIADGLDWSDIAKQTVAVYEKAIQ